MERTDVEKIREKLSDKEYDFLRNDPRLGKNVVLLGLGGSYAYGTNVPESDIDLRGIAINTKRELLTGKCFEQVLDHPTDTVIYSIKKIFSLFSECNPNTIEMLGLKKEHYLYISPIGQMILEHKDLFLSKRAFYTFGGYAAAQLRRLSNKAARSVSQAEQEEHILGSIRNASSTFPEKYFSYPEDSIRLYTDEADSEDMQKEIFMDVNLRHYPLRDYKCMWSEMNNIVKDYAKSAGKRNEYAASAGRLGKHICHLLRLFYMAFDILEKGEIVTFREKEHEELMAARNGKYLDENRQPVPELFDLVDQMEERLNLAKERSELPERPDYEKIDDLVCRINEMVLEGEL